MAADKVRRSMNKYSDLEDAIYNYNTASDNYAKYLIRILEHEYEDLESDIK